ncbi:MAG TPA: hypothetical protein VGN08_11270 [Solirubrobacteraceae bacterium]|jgi:hypothetical protein
MSRASIVGFCVVAAVAGSAVAAATAAAEPEFVTKAVVGEAVSKVPFSGTIGATFFEGQKSRTKVTCANQAGQGSGITGEVTGPKSLGKLVITYTNCLSGECAVHTAGKPEGVVESRALAGKLGEVAPGMPGIKLFSEEEGKGGTVVAAEVCAGIAKVIWKGEVTGSLSGAAGEGPETGKLLSSFKLTFAESAGVQKYKGFTEGPEEGILGQLEQVVNGSPELSGWSSIDTLKTVPSTWGLGVTK